ncbi:MAG: ABC transporter ATP-binding protein [Candidatus Bathyarchaeia archaeon]|jgi:multiple sugar transport system ATP-binding protein
MADVRLEGLTKVFGSVRAVDNVDLYINDKEFLTLLGPSGCGKTTTMRLVAGLEDPTQGKVYIGGKLVNDLPPKLRDVAMVFQNYALYPHMTVYDNISFPLRMRKYPKDKIKEKVTTTAQLLEIQELLDRKPRQLSGGQQQRVALGRAIVREPQVFLMDEPLSNLDAKLRIYMRAELKRLQKRIGITTIYVTHDQVEAMTMSDRIALMNAGAIQQLATSDQIYNHPSNLFVAGFVGNPPMNFLPCVLHEEDDKTILEAGAFKLDITDIKGTDELGMTSSELTLGIRPEDISVSQQRSTSSVEATVYVVEPLGSEVLVNLKLGNEIVKARAPPSTMVKVEDQVYLTFNKDKMHLFDKTKKLII